MLEHTLEDQLSAALQRTFLHWRENRVGEPVRSLPVQKFIKVLSLPALQKCKIVYSFDVEINESVLFKS